MPPSAAPNRSAPGQVEAGRRAAGWLSVGAGVMFLVTVGYLFTVLPATGWSIAMFDAPADLLLWVDRHQRIYQVLWLLYFVSQTCLLAVPLLLSSLGGRAAAVFGTTAVVLAMVGLALLFAVSPVVARAYSEAVVPGSELSEAGVLVVHDVLADIGKDLRLFSELLLGVWLVSTGRLLRRESHHRRWWALSALGCWTFVVAAVKLLDPTIGLEDWLGFLLGMGYLVLGVGLLRPAAARPHSTSTDRGARRTA